MLPFQSLLVVAPHADDEVLGCGGLMARMSRLGLPVHVLIVNPEYTERMGEALLAAEVLGVTSVSCSGLWPSGLDLVPQRHLIGEIERAIETYRPDAVAIPDSGAAHQDHRAVGLAGIAACRPSGASQKHRPPIVLQWEEAADAWPPRESRTPSMTVQLDATDVHAKVSAMLAHYSQVREAPSERSVDAIEALARVRGLQAGVEFGESYGVLRWLA